MRLKLGILVAALGLLLASVSIAAAATSSATTPSSPPASMRTSVLHILGARTTPARSRMHAPSPETNATKTSLAEQAAAQQAASIAASATATPAAPVLGTFDISTAAQMSAWRSAGGNAVVIPVFWQQAQPSQGGPVNLADAGNNGDNVITEIQTAHADGLAVYLELDLQYPPNWVLGNVPQYVDQGGTPWSSPQAGANVRDWVWSAVGRADVSAFVAGALSDLEPYLSARR